MITRNNTATKTNVLLKIYGHLIGEIIEDTSKIIELVFNKDSVDVFTKDGRLETIYYEMLNHNEMEQECLIWMQHNGVFVSLSVSSLEYN